MGFMGTESQSRNWTSYPAGCRCDPTRIPNENRSYIYYMFVILTLAPITSCMIAKNNLLVADVTKLPIPHLQSCFVIKNNDITILWDYVVILGFETGE